MKIALIAYSQTGMDTAKRLMDALSEHSLCAFTTKRLAKPPFSALPSPSKPFFADAFRQYDAIVFLCACGIAVRCIAPHLKDKAHDPAVLCMDECGGFVIPLLSGHIGGANALARELAEKAGAMPVITTATDVEGRFSADSWAAKYGFLIEDLQAAKAVSAAILERDVPMLCELPLRGGYPRGVTDGDSGAVGIYVGYRQCAPFGVTLRLIPRSLHLGIGCRKGTSLSAIEQAVFAVLKQEQIDIRAVKTASSIDLKKDEQGLLDFCNKYGLSAAFYSAEALAAVEGDFSASDFVKSVTGVDNVCERAAMIGAARLVVRKTAKDGVTVAIAEERTEVCFE